jgi:hypothetical protein
MHIVKSWTHSARTPDSRAAVSDVSIQFGDGSIWLLMKLSFWD